MIVWDSPGSPPDDVERVYIWNGYGEAGCVYSLLRYAEINAERLRTKYLSWIHDLGESRIGDKRLIDHLAFADGLSYWWMTLLVEKSFYKSPISDAIRLLALEEIVVRQRPDNIRLVSADKSLHEAIARLCRGLGIVYERERPHGSRLCRLNLGEIYRRVMPQPLQAPVSLARHIWRRWPFRQAERSAWFADKQATFFCSYFFNLDSDSARKGHFHSRYWEGLHSLMRRMGMHGNWLQIYVPHDATSNPVAAMKWINGFNRNQSEQGFHAFLDAYLSWGIVFRVFKRWIWLNLISWRLRAIRYAFQPQGSHLSLWPLMQQDWYASLRGPAAIHNLLSIELFDVALRDLPKQKKGFYLCENQAWERALIHAWRKHGHGQLIAVPHATVRFWDLRYFADPRTIQASEQHPMPQPDRTALNGKAAVDAYLAMDYPEKNIVECEALRFLYLNELRFGQASGGWRKGMIKVLILGDYTPSGTVKMLQLLEAAAPTLDGRVRFTLKPHPNYMVDPADYPSLGLKVVTSSLKAILREFDIAYASSITSAAVDAYLAGLKVLVMLDATELNFSPLLGRPGVSFVGTKEELTVELCAREEDEVAMSKDEKDFFFLDPELPRWQKLMRV